METNATINEEKSRFALGLRTKLAFAFTLISIIVSAISAYGYYVNQQEQLIKSIQRRVLSLAEVASLQQNGDEFTQIASANDPLYEKFRLQNIKIKESDPDLIFVYTMRKDEKGIYFVVDAGEIGSEDFSAYGDRYDDASQTLKDNFDSMESAIVESEVYPDQYGTFLSAYAPIFDQNGTKVGGFPGA